MFCCDAHSLAIVDWAEVETHLPWGEGELRVPESAAKVAWLKGLARRRRRFRNGNWCNVSGFSADGAVGYRVCSSEGETPVWVNRGDGAVMVNLTCPLLLPNIFSLFLAASCAFSPSAPPLFVSLQFWRLISSLHSLFYGPGSSSSSRLGSLSHMISLEA